MAHTLIFFKPIIHILYHIWLRIIGFNAIDYQAGAFYSRKTAAENPGFQIDLVYIRSDRRILICEIKYQARSSDARKIAAETDSKKSAFIETSPIYRNHTCETVLITAEIAGDKDSFREHFDHVITLDDIFNSHYWK